LLKELWPQPIPVSEVFARLNALPGPPVESKKLVGIWAVASLRVRRPPGMVPANQRDGSIFTARYATPARIALIRELWPTAIANHEISARLNALPGPPVPHGKTLANWAARLGLRRPAGLFPITRGAALAARAGTVTFTGADRTPIPAGTPVQTADGAQYATVAAIAIGGTSAIAAQPPAAAAQPPATAVQPPAPVTQPPAPAEPPPRPAAQPPAAAPASGLPRWTRERIAILKANYETRPEDDLLADLNALPGPAITLAWMHGYATGALKLAPSAPPRFAGSPPLSAPRFAIAAWAAGKGWSVEPFNLAAINAHCGRIGHPGWVEEPAKARAA
jgi:hypothetical protein